MTRRMLTRGQAARVLGLSIARVRQLQDEWILQSRVDRRGWHMFDEVEVDILRRERARACGEDPFVRTRPDEGERGRSTCDDCGKWAFWLTDPVTEQLAETGVCPECWPARRVARRRVSFARLQRR